MRRDIANSMIKFTTQYTSKYTLKNETKDETRDATNTNKGKVMIIDNYDSFTYNLYQYIGEIRTDIDVNRNDEITIDEVMEKKPSHIILSPGPGFPKDAGICVELIKRLDGRIPLLGVCLGHQAIGEAYGADIVHARELMHGKASLVNVDMECELFKGLPEKITAGRYHSLIVKKETIPLQLKITAWTEDGEVMGLKHAEYPVFGVQFHPESILTPDGKQIIRNFLNIKY